jgi:hypothetical protein
LWSGRSDPLGYKALRTTAKAPQTINKDGGIAKASTPDLADGELAAAVPVPGATLFATVPVPGAALSTAVSVPGAALFAGVDVPAAALFAAVGTAATPVPIEKAPADANTCGGIEPASAANAAGVMTLV